MKELIDRLNQINNMEAFENEVLMFDGSIETAARIQAGAYYTPLELAKEMVEDSIRTYLENCGFTCDQVNGLLSVTSDQGHVKSMMDKLSRAYFLDMACGTGVFAYAYLLTLRSLCENHRMDFGPLFDKATSGMVLNDLNKNALSLLCLLFEKRFGSTGNITVLNQNALTELRGHSEIERICQTGGFDLIIGNPPYLGERGNKSLFEPLKAHELTKGYYEGKMDLFYFFLHHAMDLVSDKGVVTQITTSYFTTADGAKKLRASLKSKMDFRRITHLEAYDLFKDVKKLSFLIYSITPKQTGSLKNMIFKQDDNIEILTQEDLYDDYGQIVLRRNIQWHELLTKAQSNSSAILSEVLTINQGLVSGADRFTKRLAVKYPQMGQEEGPIFVFLKDELPKNMPGDLFKSFIKNGQIKPYRIRGEIDKYVLYSVGDKISGYPEWIEHLSRYREHLEKRREVRNGSKAWYELQWGRKETVFTGAKIVVPQRARQNSFALCTEEYYGSADIYYLSDAKEDLTTLKAFTVYLNSSWIFLWLYHMGKRKGELLELYATPLGRIPVPKFSKENMLSLALIHDEYMESENDNLLRKAELIIGKTFDFTEEQIEKIMEFKLSH
ncbi:MULTISPECIES: Eco57I restriction-modification methylase domain-containing protein [unclassified Fusibacter]|uniref:Eco57I restriction-modification methylase domain-containing protein n=1 Tax=unclassified Fusibacter TaxID=2624464 RepID=UPI0013E93444|nr:MULTISPECIES: Eco57I restriction-modification methylase domain-containing protein [unclassified Fusibacter]MCK8060700.1 Eco57I restriction-modification methylase domain-containing protein [Fusibacter sp. A2]NPE22846.1 hypothetical protein [Fusibacter sp. A1]